VGSLSSLRRSTQQKSAHAVCVLRHSLLVLRLGGAIFKHHRINQFKKHALAASRSICLAVIPKTNRWHKAVVRESFDGLYHSQIASKAATAFRFANCRIGEGSAAQGITASPRSKKLHPVCRNMLVVNSNHRSFV